MLDFWLAVGPVLFLLALGFFIGSWRERSHIASLDRREGELRDVRVVNLKRIADPNHVRESSLVMGEAVIATDYFKTFAAQLRNIVGGEVRTFDTLLKRARREALIRLLQNARDMGASEVWNVRFETSNIMSSTSGNKNPAACVEIFAFGTAVVRA